jgi:lipid II:glycine glycyltransferase (peptidoglycan interpeptide bridge formation enzyme)
MEEAGQVTVQGLRTQSETNSPRTTVPGLSSSEAERWDQFVEAAPGGDLIQTTAWAQAKRALGFEVCQVISRRSDEIVGGGQIVIKRFGPLGGVGYIARGPLVSSRCSEQAARILEEVERSARAKHVRHLIVQPPAGGSEIAAALAARGYDQNAPAVAPTATLCIDLSQSLNQILAGMSARRRGEVRCSQRRGGEVRIGGRGDIDVFQAMHEATARRQCFAAMSRSYLRHQWDALHWRGWLQLFLAYHQGRPLAGIWVTAFGDTVTYRLPGWTGEARDLRLNAACHWTAIQWAKEHGYRYYDLGGIDRRYAERIAAKQPLPDELPRSPAAFKIRFGGDPVLLPTASQFTFNPIVRLFGRVVFSQLARRKSFRQLVHRLRNG